MSTSFRKAEMVRAVERMALLNEFTSRYRSRIVAGLAKYGEFVAATDPRCLSHEAIEEVLDVGSYLEMLEQKRPELTPGIQKIRAKAILLYGELKKLEELELTLGKEGTK